MRICAYAVMSNHWHLLLWPECVTISDLSRFPARWRMQWASASSTLASSSSAIGETGQVVESPDDSGQQPKHAGTVGRDVFRLESGLGPQIDHDHFPALQTFRPMVALAEVFHHPRKAGLTVGMVLRGRRLLTWVVGSFPLPLLNEPPGDLAGLVRADRTKEGGSFKPGNRRRSSGTWALLNREIGGSRIS